MYEVKLNNEKIHELSVRSNRRLSAGKLAEEVNQIPSFSFTIPCMNPAFSQELHDRKDIIVLENTITSETEFDGHLLSHSQSMDANGKLCIKCIAEGHLGYLCDSIQMYHSYVDTSPADFLTALLTNHNSEVVASGHPEKMIQLGTVSITRSDYRRSKTTAYRNTLEEIRVNLIERIGGEIRVRRVNGHLVLDYVDRIGVNSSTEIKLAKNMKSLSVDIDTTNIVTRLIPLGAQLSPGDSAERLTIESVNSGKPYIDDTAGITKYGIIVGTVEFDDITVASNLLTAGTEYLQNNSRIRKSYEAQALDLSLIQDDYQPLVCGNTYIFNNSFLGLYERLRLFGRTVDIYKPYTPTLRIGDKAEKITDIETRTTRLIEYELPQQKQEILAAASTRMSEMVANATKGYIFTDEERGELLIMDTPSKETAQKVWRWNSSGLAYSDRGYNDGYFIGMTADGKILASSILAGILQGFEILNGSGTFHVHTDGTVDASAINITGGSINISTDTASYDVIDLTCDSWHHNISPLQWSLENTNTLCEIVGQAGALFFNYNGARTMSLSAQDGSVHCNNIYSEDIHSEDNYAADVYADELYYRTSSGSGTYYSVRSQIDALWDAVHALQGGS